MKKIQSSNLIKMSVLIVSLFTCNLSSASELIVSVEPMELQWLDLVPDKLKNKPPAVIDHNQEPSQLPMSPSLDQIKQELNGSYVKMAGFMVPLDGDDGKVTVFLLVPFFGACIHVPPPPPNQIIYVEFPEGVDADIVYDPVWIEGVIEAGVFESDMAISGYKMKPINVIPYIEK